jgi:hypothetical protein
MQGENALGLGSASNAINVTTQTDTVKLQLKQFCRRKSPLELLAQTAIMQSSK